MPPRRILALLTSVVLVQACGGGDSSTPSEPEPSPTASSISVSPSSATSNALEDTTDFSATVRDQNGSTMSDVSVSWSSTSQGVASVASDGQAVSQGNGTADIVASADGLADSATLTVDQKAVQVTVSPGADTLTAGDSAQLSADATDANGHTVTSPTFTWSSSDTSVATVDSTGFVRTKTDGSVDVTAELDGVTDTSAVTVAPPPGGAPSVSSVSPSPLPEGGSATISGFNFSSDPASNTVVVDGDTAQVVSATSTSLDINVPLYDCLPARSVPVKVTTSAGVDSVAASLSPDEPPVQLAVGEQGRFGDPSNFCLQFESSGASERYLIGVQSLSGTHGSLTPVTVTSEANDASGSASVSSLSTSTESAALRQGNSPSESPALEEHRRAEMSRRQWAVNNLNPSASLPAHDSESMLETSAIVDGSVQVGDTVSMRVPDGRTSDLCANYVEVGGVVRAIGTQGIFVADTSNPSGGFTDTDYQDFSNRMDQDIFSTLVDYFGTPTDLDSNGRVVVLISKAVNVTNPNALGFVFPGDLFPRSTSDGSLSCASSDEGEIYYGKAPDPNGVYGSTYPTDEARSKTPFIMSHELTHVIQSSRRFSANQPFMSSIVAEGQATLGEEVVGHSVTGRTTGQNYGFTTAFNANGTDAIDWYSNAFGDLTGYFGFESSTSEVAEAPDQCGWWREDPSPCLSRALWYGVGWSFLRWASDQYGPGYSGGEKGFHQDLIGSSGTGPQNVANVLGQDFQQIMANWAASLYVDDRIAGADPKLETTSWNYYDIFENNLVDPATLNPFEAGFTDWGAVGDIRASSAGYIAVDGNGRPATALKIRDSTGATLPSYMQIWVVRLQ